MALTQAYVGTNSIGASNQTPATTTAYCKKVTIPANSVLSAIEGHLALTDGNTFQYRVGVWSDNAGAVARLISLSEPLADTILGGGTDRWLGAAVGRWFASSTDVWIGIHIFDPTGVTLAFDSGTGSDVRVITGGIWTGETGAVGTTVTVGTNDYSIRGLVIS